MVTATSEITHYVFVDFENVPSIDLGAIDGKPVHVTLMIGKNQKKIDLALVHQIKRHAARVELIEVGAAGHNALDLTLGYYLGQSVLTSPQAQFHIVSKDTDFDPLIAHLLAKKIRAARHVSFAALPFLPQPKTAVPKKSVNHKQVATPKVDPTAGDTFAKLVARLTLHAASSPKKRSSLLAHIKTSYGNKLSDTQLNDIVEELAARGILSIDAAGKVSYSTGA
jgi:PIN domain-containing protein